ncbi:hypothetical protein GGI20_000267 [Coemansia sp. BCRC 34301]|nr:hypothetical protein GGI20_000267 [Coemansia sp. BCRC 34301]
MLRIAGRQASRREVGKWLSFAAATASRRRQFSAAPIARSVGGSRGNSDGLASDHSGADQSGYISQIGSEGEYPLIIRVMQAALESIHDGAPPLLAMETGVPWWGVIAGSAFALRAALILPMYIYQQRALARAQSLAGISKLWYRSMRASLQLELATRTPPGTDKELEQLLIKRLTKRRHLLLLKQGCHPIFSLALPLTQLPIWISMSFCLRHLSGRLVPLLDSATSALPAAAPGMSSEGILWFTNLTAADSTGVLPAITGMVFLANSLTHLYRRNEYAAANSLNGVVPRKTVLIRAVSYLSFASPLLITYMAMSQPTALVFYWLSSSSFMLAQNLVFHNQWLRKRLKFIYIK